MIVENNDYIQVYHKKILIIIVNFDRKKIIIVKSTSLSLNK